MQLTHLVKRSGRAVWLLLVVPVVAVAASIALLAGTQAPVRTLATVSVIAPEGSSTAATVTQAVDGFASTVTSDTVLRLASDETGIPIESGDVSAQRVGTSNLVELRLSTEDGQDGQAALASLVAHANDSLFASTLAASDSRVETAENRYQEALDERALESSRTGLLLPIEAYRAKASEVTQLRVALATGGPDINEVTVQSNLDKAIEDLARIGKSVNAFESLEDSVVRARTELGDAKQESDAVTTRLAAATAPESVTITDSVRQSARTTLARAAIAALIVGLALGLALVLLIGLLRRPERHSRARQPRDSDDAGTDADPDTDAGRRSRPAPAGDRETNDRESVLT
jgi:hypothetical protein